MKKIEPIFIIGVDRSGTTLLSLMMASHSRIAIPYESHFFIPFYKNISSYGDLTQRKNRELLVNEILSERYVRRWDQKINISDINIDKCTSLALTINQIYTAYAKKLGKDIWGDKSPDHTKEIHIINRLFPDSRFIHIIRDGRDVASSLVQQWWGPGDFITAICYWKYTIECARKMLRMLPEYRFIELNFENLIVDPENQLKNITKFLGLEFEQSMIRDYMMNADIKVGRRI